MTLKKLLNKLDLGIIEFLALNILGLAIFFFFLFLIIGFRKVLVNFYNKRKRSLRLKYVNAISKHIYTESVDLEYLKKLPFSLILKDVIVSLAKDLAGNQLNKAKALYCHLDFLKVDQKNLLSNDKTVRLKAIDSIEKLKLALDEDTYAKLFKDSFDSVRFLSMLNYIEVNKKKSSFRLISFIDSKKYSKKGHLFFLIQRLGHADNSSLNYLFERSNDPVMDEAILASAEQKPPRGMDEIIYKKYGQSTKVGLLIWSLRVLKHYPTSKMIKLAKTLSDHQAWAVRLHVVKCLDPFEYEDSKELLKEFTYDPSFLVRLKLSELILKKEASCKELIDIIESDAFHPCRNILEYLRVTKEIQRVA